ncbi:MAG: cell wall hydrolase, partial [Caulobacteraceae bacterium]
MQAFSQRMGSWGWRLNAFVLALCLVTIVHSSANSNAPANVDSARNLARHAGDLSDHALKSMIAGLDPNVAVIASRYDPGLPKAPQSHAPGWPTYDLTYTPLFDLRGLDAEEAKRVNDLTPGLREIEPATPFVLQAKLPAERERAVRCLTNAIYYEAALESVDGQRAVAQVVLNRVRDPNFPKSICGVVYEGWERATGCQFSFTCDNALLRAPMAPFYQNSRKVAEAALAGSVMGEVGTATHYHADYVAPYWGPTL